MADTGNEALSKYECLKICKLPCRGLGGRFIRPYLKWVTSITDVAMSLWPWPLNAFFSWMKRARPNIISRLTGVKNTGLPFFLFLWPIKLQNYYKSKSQKWGTASRSPLDSFECVRQRPSDRKQQRRRSIFTSSVTSKLYSLLTSQIAIPQKVDEDPYLLTVFDLFCT